MKYLGYYDTIENGRLMSPASVNKMDYIINLLVRSGKQVEVISCGMTSVHTMAAEERKLDKNVSVRFFRTIKRNNKSFINRLWCKIYENMVLLFYLIRNVERDEYVVVYHSLLNMNTIRLAKRIVKFKIILEVEEIYNDVTFFSKKSQEQEKRYISEADAYIFSNYLLDKKYNNGKRSLVIHGAYKLDGVQTTTENVSKKIEVVYAGTFDVTKGGVYAAIKSAVLLPENYHINILGFGDDNAVDNVIKLIESTNKISKAQIEYKGLLLGKEFIEFLNQCDIGLSTQKPNAKYNDSSFPSKILTYINCGLVVVSTNIEAVKTSDISKLVVFYNDDTAEAIASAILSITEFNKNKNKEALIKLDSITQKKFESFIETLLGGEKYEYNSFV